MNQIFLLSFSFIIIIIFALIFDDKIFDRYYDKIKDKKKTWFWFEVFKIEQTKENMWKFLKIISVFVICINFIAMLYTAIGLLK